MSYSKNHKPTKQPKLKKTTKLEIYQIYFDLSYLTVIIFVIILLLQKYKCINLPHNTFVLI